MPTPLSHRARLTRLADLIAASPHNLVSRRDRGLLHEVHVPEAAALAPLLPVAAGQRWLDLGTGGGLPGLVLAVVLPDVEWVLLDSTRKKVEAVRGFAAALELPNVTTVAERAEVAGRQPHLREGFDGVVARAVAPLQILLELARGFPRPGGAMAAVKGPGWPEEVRAAQAAIAALRWSAPRAAAVASAVRPTWLVTLHAEGPPPARYPRGVGVPHRSPLGGVPG